MSVALPRDDSADVGQGIGIASNVSLAALPATWVAIYRGFAYRRRRRVAGARRGGRPRTPVPASTLASEVPGALVLHTSPLMDSSTTPANPAELKKHLGVCSTPCCARRVKQKRDGKRSSPPVEANPGHTMVRDTAASWLRAEEDHEVPVVRHMVGVGCEPVIGPKFGSTAWWCY